MITENIILNSDLKKKLKHLSIDINQHVSTMLTMYAEKILEEDYYIHLTSSDEEYESFTMKIDEDLKNSIRVFCMKRGVKMKDFWNEAAFMLIQDAENKGFLR